MKRMVAVGALLLLLGGCGVPIGLGAALGVGSGALGWIAAGVAGVTAVDNLAGAARTVAGVICDKERPKPHSAALADRIAKFCDGVAKAKDEFAILDAAAQIAAAIRAESF